MPKKKELPDKVNTSRRKGSGPSSLTCSESGSGIAIICAEESLKSTTGVKNPESLNYLLRDIIGLAKRNLLRNNQVLSILGELRPQDAYEGILVTQMLLVNDRAKDCFRMAERNKSFAAIYSDLQNQGIKLMRLFNQQLEALDRHRRKGNQKMVVEHVDVHRGAQAIVGNVSPGGEGGKQ